MQDDADTTDPTGPAGPTAPAAAGRGPDRPGTGAAGRDDGGRDAATTPVVPRRSVLLAGAGVAGLAVVGLGAAACDSPAPTPNDRLRRLADDLAATARDRRAAGDVTLGDLLAAQAEAVRGEVSRQCGTDRSGATPDSCTADGGGAGGAGDTGTPAPGSSAEAAAAFQERMLALVASTPGDAGVTRRGSTADTVTAEQARLLTGLVAALAPVSGRPTVAAMRDGSSDAPGRLSDAARDELGEVLDRCLAAVYASGLALPVAGAGRAAVTGAATAMRALRDAVWRTPAPGSPAVGAAGAGDADRSATPPAGYRLPEGATDPSGPGDATDLMRRAVHAVTVELRRAVPTLEPADRGRVARWCAVSARNEAALESPGTPPPAVRGE
ncbi:hypothetical protein QP948_02775 [Corynebacterium bovis]|uniref:hypothetical protein n=1 Tax=Corynebacterium bovis TaxID=36808 RepID=UPI0025505881|nr:hypothetical protein [Corynebacterium bovis]MDK8510335.1 hypothetical protein [Corynebacterium bovis]